MLAFFLIELAFKRIAKDYLHTAFLNWTDKKEIHRRKLVRDRKKRKDFHWIKIHTLGLKLYPHRLTWTPKKAGRINPTTTYTGRERYGIKLPKTLIVWRWRPEACNWLEGGKSGCPSFAYEIELPFFCLWGTPSCAWPRANYPILIGSASRLP